LLSALAEAPITQALAVTGSVDQRGQIQTIGGVNEKIEGFFDACRGVELTGKQGVVISGRQCAPPDVASGRCDRRGRGPLCNLSDRQGRSGDRVFDRDSSGTTGRRGGLPQAAILGP
jgi:Lon protease (S16) C-terminal proteolytic domain